MGQESVQILSIHDHKQSVLAFDLKEVLQALNARFARCVWIIRNLDCFGGEACEETCRAVENSGGAGVWMSWEELVQLAAQIQQTIDGEFLAFSSDIERATITDEDLDLGQFPTSNAQSAVLAI